MTAASPLKICVVGASGRLGRLILSECVRRDDLEAAGGVVRYDSVQLGTDLGERAGRAPVAVETVVGVEDAARGADVIVDVAAPAMTEAIAKRILDGALTQPLVTGVTGLSDDQSRLVREAGERTAVLQARNFSLGAALMERLVALAAAALPADSWDLEIIEAHHRRKADAPSGTAIMIGEAAAAARGLDFDREAMFERPRTGGARPIGAIGFSAVRGGGVVGEHAARFLNSFEEVEIAHKAHDRFIFARGAVEAALWLAGRPAGFYTLQDVVSDRLEAVR